MSKSPKTSAEIKTDPYLRPLTIKAKLKQSKNGKLIRILEIPLKTERKTGETGILLSGFKFVTRADGYTAPPQ